VSEKKVDNAVPYKAGKAAKPHLDFLFFEESFRQSKQKSTHHSFGLFINEPFIG